ncbi:aldotetraouronic acid ABC transporter substrate-binding protein [Gracilibacillus ureilyticus]|uniref:Aldotetraouronic acid ABC transporter substrate-binding protein n=1 Tax=Gracilibacillus ureilyticus TaxID=531814 RepID=A0A1H9PSZ2_9BACI|nr:ABC transporter substrate-binding protein [Gracilibacillus ureilyticus]SER50693.1 aldotetraouronic acid ABC transporter substrate-binding protein [Gracilibacillus ureilyticus]
MRKQFVWLLSLLIALLFVASACSDDSQNTSSDDGNDTNDGGESGDVITYDFFDASGPGEDINTSETTIGKMFEEETGVNFDIEHIVGDVNQKVGTMIASGEYPELLNAEQSTDAVIDAGGFVPLNDLIEEHAPNIKKMYGPYLEYMKRDDGNIYIIPSGASHGYVKPANLEQGAWWIKRDVLKELGYPQPKTLDEYFAIIEEYTAANPEIDGANTIGFTALTHDWRFFALSNQPNHLAGYPNDGGIMIDMDTLEADAYPDNPETERWLKKLNEVNDKGLFDQESFTQNYDEYLAKITSGRVVGFFDYRWQVGQALDTLAEDEDPYNDYMGFPIVFEEGITDQYLDPVGFAASPGIGITTAASEEDQIRIIKFLDHIAKEETQKLITWGKEGETYEIDENGRYYRTEEQIETTSNTEFRDSFGFSYFEWGWPRMNGLYEDGNAVEPPKQQEVASLMYDDGDKEFLEAYEIETFTELFAEPEERPWYPAWDTPIETGSPAQLYEQQLDDLMKRKFPEIIFANPSDFDSQWSDFKSSFETLPYEEYENVITESVKRKVEIYEQAQESAE